MWRGLCIPTFWQSPRKFSHASKSCQGASFETYLQFLMQPKVNHTLGISRARSILTSGRQEPPIDELPIKFTDLGGSNLNLPWTLNGCWFIGSLTFLKIFCWSICKTKINAKQIFNWIESRMTKQYKINYWHRNFFFFVLQLTSLSGWLFRPNSTCCSSLT